MLSVEHIVSLIVLALTGVGSNVLFLLTIKKRPTPRNSIDLLQLIKTWMVLAGLVLCIIVELIPCADTSWRVCTVSNDIINDFTFHSTCWMFLCVAFIRLKVCTCRGRASVLVTSRYVMRTLAVCSMPVVITSLTSLVLAVYDSEVDTDRPANTPSALSPSLMSIGTHDTVIRLFRLLFLDVFPLLVGSLIYRRVIKIVKDTSVNTEELVSNRKVNVVALITNSVLVLVIITILMWLVYISLAVCNIFMEISPLLILYWKILMMIVHPLAEGLARRYKVWPKTIKSTVTPLEHGTKGIFQTTTSSACGMNGNVRWPTHEFCGPESSSITPSFKGRYQLNDSNSTKNTPRKSIVHSKASFHFQDGSLVKLQVKNSSQIQDFQNKRKISRSKLKDSLEDIDSITEANHSGGNNRETPNSKRISHAGFRTEDEIFENYSIAYQRRLSSMFPQHRRSNQEVNGFEAPGKDDYPSRSARSHWTTLLNKTRLTRKVLPADGSTPATIDEKEDSVSDDRNDNKRNMSPSLEHWRNIVKTTTTVKQLSHWKDQRHLESKSPSHWCAPYKPLARVNKGASTSFKPKFIEESQLSVAAFGKQPHKASPDTLDQQIRNLPTDSTSNYRSKISKSGKKSERSISCVSRSELDQQLLRNIFPNNLKKTRNISVSFGPGYVDSGQNRRPNMNIHKSHSQDQSYSKDNVDTNDERIRNKYSRHSRGSFSCDVKENMKNECIEKLRDMNKYF